MRLSKLTLLPVCLLFCKLIIAQKDPDLALHKLNIVKVNVTSPVLNNYSVQYERILNKRISVAISGRLMPESNIPFKNYIGDRITNDGDIELVDDILNTVKFSNYAITPEVRFYLGKKGYGQGFYIAPYYRFADYKIHQGTVSITEAGQNYQVQVSGNLKSHTGGVLLGSQWNLGKTIGLDLWILGPNIGAGNGSIVGLSNTTLTDAEQADLRRHLRDIDIPYIKETITVNANGATMDLDGLWAGVRAGLMFTFRF